MNSRIIIMVIAFIAIACTMSAGCIIPSPPSEPEYEKFVINYTIVDTINSMGDETSIEKVYDFSYSGKKWHIVAQVPKYRYDNYVEEKYLVFKQKPSHSEPEKQRAFIYDEYVMDVVEQFKTQNGDLSDQELIEVLTYFVQTQIIYEEDPEQYGEFEYVAYPMQALINGKGDCDCRAILLASLYMHAGYDSISVSILPTGYNVGHVLVGISYSGLDVKSNAKAIEHNQKKYYLVEATGESPIGISTFINEDVDEWREINEQGCKSLYVDNVIESISNYEENLRSFKDSETGERISKKIFR